MPARRMQNEDKRGALAAPFSGVVKCYNRSIFVYNAERLACPFVEIVANEWFLISIPNPDSVADAGRRFPFPSPPNRAFGRVGWDRGT